jgi:hypothetical protein
MTGANLMIKTLFSLLTVTLAVALNATAQLTPASPANLPDAAPAAGNYAPGYTPSATPLPDADTSPAAQAHVPESATLIVGCIMLVPLGVSLVRVFRRRHVLP